MIQKLLEYLSRNLFFGCIKTKQFYITELSDCTLFVVTLYPYKSFCEQELSIIRTNALETKKVREFSSVKIENLHLRSNGVMVVYIIS